ncbi:GNAT family N-acetyltransferase [Pantoea sp. Ap-967]|uniref:GNAT family N-acetyltransferase n=1 Tax=Pantoea sp. Ap-967 TaxID=2608362 RepID=UPI00196504D6|nr:GNAT family N-acetyltransferase [Pantoea sp. Ap-967]
MDCYIRQALPNDAVAISQVIISALRTSNAADYDARTIARVEASFSAPAIIALLTQRQVFVALIDENVVATASLENDVVRSVFVCPDHQGLGIGRQLMQVIEQHATASGLSSLRVPSSITAEWLLFNAWLPEAARGVAWR